MTKESYYPLSKKKDSPENKRKRGIPNSTSREENKNEETKDYYLHNFEKDAYSYISKNVSYPSFFNCFEIFVWS